MDCERVREALSARVDGEDTGVAPAQLDAHVAGCPGCAGWLEHAQQVTRSVRLQPVQVPDLTARVLAAVAADRQAADRRAADRRHRPRRTVLRVAVALIALAQVALAVPVLIGADLHIGREIACFELALAAGFGFVAWRPEWARALVPVAVVLAVALGMTSVVDVAGADTTAPHEAGHLAAVVQAGLLWALARTTGTGRPHPVAGTAVTVA